MSIFRIGQQVHVVIEVRGFDQNELLRCLFRCGAREFDFLSGIELLSR